MRALVIGRGSMGRRRIRDLTALGVEVASWDITDDAPLAVHPQLVVVCTPPGTHAQYVASADAPVLATFTEADVEAVDAPHYPSATSRFTGFYGLLRRLLDGEIEEMSAYTLHVGQHLADWHPGADLVTYYAAQRQTGACREMVPFELCWLTGLFGRVVEAKAVYGGAVAQTAIDAVYQVIVRHESNTLGHILIDALSRPSRRAFTIVSDGYTRSFSLAYEEADYLAEMRAFVDAAQGRAPWPYSQADEAANLEVLHMIERSA